MGAGGGGDRSVGRVTSARFSHRYDRASLPAVALGFRRTVEPPHVLEVDAQDIGLAVGLIVRYAVGTVSIAQLAAETGFEEWRRLADPTSNVNSSWPGQSSSVLT